MLKECETSQFEHLACETVSVDRSRMKCVVLEAVVAMAGSYNIHLCGILMLWCMRTSNTEDMHECMSDSFIVCVF